MRWSVDHVGFTVPDLDQAVQFFVEGLHCELVFRAGPYPDVGFVWPEEAEPEQVELRLAMVTHGSTHNIELLEYRAGGTSDWSEAPRPSQRGASHLAFYVDDVQAAVDHLKGFDGVRLMGEVAVEDGGPLDGLNWIYLLTPWGMVLELIHWEPGLPYEKTTKARLVAPRGHAEGPRYRK